MIDATEQLIRDQGFAAVTSRIVAAAVGVRPPLLHYYFNSMDDLFVEVFRRGAEADLERLAHAVASKDPLRSMWKLSHDPKATRFVTEFMAMANHNEPVRAEITRYAEKRRKLQAEGLSRHLAARGLKPRIPPLVLAVLMENVARGQMLESALGISLGHEETEAFVQACLKLFDERGEVGSEGSAPEAAPESAPESAPGRGARRTRAKAVVDPVPSRTARRRG